MNYHFKTNGVESNAQAAVISVVIKTAVIDYLKMHNIDLATYADNLDVDRYKLNAFINNMGDLEEFTLAELDHLTSFHGLDVIMNVTVR